MPSLASVRVRKDTIGDRVTYAIQRSRKKLEQVAEDANVTAAWLSALKNDRIKNPAADKVRAIARATDHPIEYFSEVLGWTDPQAASDWRTWLAGLDVSDEDREALARVIERFVPNDT